MKSKSRAHVGRVKTYIDGVLLTSRSGGSFVCLPCGEEDEFDRIKSALAEILAEVEMAGYRRGQRETRVRRKEKNKMNKQETTLCSRCNTECFDYRQEGCEKICGCCVWDMLEHERALADKLAHELKTSQFDGRILDGDWICTECGGAHRHRNNCARAQALAEHEERRRG